MWAEVNETDRAERLTAVTCRMSLEYPARVNTEQLELTQSNLSGRVSGGQEKLRCVRVLFLCQCMHVDGMCV